MKVELKSIVSISEANQNFSRVARMVDKSGSAVILKNNKPRYIILDYDKVADQESPDNTVKSLAESIITRNIEAFKELAK